MAKISMRMGEVKSGAGESRVVRAAIWQTSELSARLREETGGG